MRLNSQDCWCCIGWFTTSIEHTARRGSKVIKRLPKVLIEVGWMLNWIFWKTLRKFLKRGICFKTPIYVSLNLYSQQKKRNKSTVSASLIDTNQSSFGNYKIRLMIWYDPHGFMDVACDTMNVAGNPVSSSTFLPHVEPQLQHVLSTWVSHSTGTIRNSAVSQYCLKPLAVYTSSVHLWHWPKPEISQEIKV